MDIIAAAAEALQPISSRGIVVKQGWYDESLKKIHITLWNLSDAEEGYSDDTNEAAEGYLQVNIWAEYDAEDLKAEVKKLLKGSGFYYQEGNDAEESKPKIFHKAMRFYRMQEEGEN